MNDQHIMRLALLKARSLDSLAPNELTLLAELFNLPPPADYEQGLGALKQVISGIILVERNYLEEYLGLPKFRKLSVYTCAKLIAYFKELFDLFMAEAMALNKPGLEEIQLPKSPGDKLSQSFGEVMAPEVRDPASRMNFNFFPQFGGGLPEPRMGFPPTSISPYLFPYQNFMGGSVVGNLAPMQNNLFEDYNGQGAGLIDNLIIQNPSEELPAQMEQFNFKQEEVSEKDPEKDIESENMSSDRPEGCFCGETGDETLIKCRNCQKQFHFKCWQAQVMVDSICPACRLATHCYTRLAGPPVLERWNRVDEQLVNSKKMSLSEEEMERLDNYVEMAEKSGRCWIQLRFVKISKEQENREGKSGFRSCFPLAIGEVKKIQSRRWIEIKFKNIGKGECIILLLVCVTTKDLPELSRELQIEARAQQTHFTSNWLKTQGVRSYRLNLVHPLSKKKIGFPVRGSRCTHIECEDLAVVYEQGIKQPGRIVCSYCRKQYSAYESFQCDPEVLQLMQQHQQDSEIQLGHPTLPVALPVTVTIDSSSAMQPQDAI